ncbi:MAG: PAS domain-containing protein [Thermodesulfovibrionales bacterium]
MKVRDKTIEGPPERIGSIRDCFMEIDRLETKQKTAERCFPAEQDWHEIFDTITDMVTIHDSDFTIIHANKAAEKILGLPVLASKAKCYEYYHGSDSPPVGCPSCKCFGSGKTKTFEMFEPHLNMHIEIRAIPRLDDDGRVIGLIHIVRDITNRKLAEEELNVHRNHLEWLVRERTSEITSMNEQLQKEIAERKRTGAEKERLIKELQEALSNVKKLSGLLPMCAWCKKIRDDQGYWKKVEAYVCEHSDTKFTHGICPDCAGKLIEEIG